VLPVGASSVIGISRATVFAPSGMSEHKRLYLLISIMTAVSLFVGGIAIYMLYGTAMHEARLRLMETAQSQARLIEAIARFDAVESRDIPRGPAAATIRQIADAHRNFEGVGQTGEFTLARRDGDQIIFLINHRHHDLENLQPVRWDSQLAQPMRLALSGDTGTIVAVDYRGATVLAAYEPVAELELGIVAKIDLAEVRAPFVRAGKVVFASSVLVVFVASLLFLRISNPMIHHIHEQHARLRAILETAAEGIVTFDQQGIIESFNPAAGKMFGYSDEDVIGQHVRMLAAETCRDIVNDFLTDRRQPEQPQTAGIRYEIAGMRKEGSEFPIDLAISKVDVGGLRFFTGIIRDITDRKRAEQNARLAAIGRMLSTVAHESRNSLQRVQAGIDMLRLDLTDNPAFVEQLDRIERAGSNLNRLHEELRQYAAPITLDRRTCDLRETWQHAWANLSHLRDGRQTDLIEEVNGLDLHCTLDEFRMEQVFRNLMENSLGACSDATTIELRCYESMHNGAPAVCVSFRDNGPGLTDDQVKRVFEAFYTTKSKGTGLGMAIAHRILRAHQGTIAVGSHDHRGAEFIITIPRQDPQANR
jgi:PAS domain S-box-containing protein